MRTGEVNGRLWGARADDWARLQEPVHGPVYAAALEASGVGPGTRYLDVGCGAGLTVQMAAARGAAVSGLDAAADLLAIAGARTPAARLVPGDLEDLPFEDASFDVVTGINAFQYAGDPGAALAEARRVVAGDGRVVIATWGAPEGMEAATLVAALKPLLPPPPPGAPGPFALSDETALRGFATGAGLHPMDVFDVDSPFHYTDEETAVRGLCSAGVAVKAMETVGEDAVVHAYRQAVAPFVQTDGRVVVAARFRCLVARPR